MNDKSPLLLLLEVQRVPQPVAGILREGWGWVALHKHLYPGWGEDQRKICAYISHVAQVTWQVSLLELIAWEQGRKLVITFLLHIICCIGLCTHLFYKLSIIHHIKVITITCILVEGYRLKDDCAHIYTGQWYSTGHQTGFIVWINCVRPRQQICEHISIAYNMPFWATPIFVPTSHHAFTTLGYRLVISWLVAAS